MKKLQEFAGKAKGNAALSNSVLRSFGLNDEMIIALKQMAFTKSQMAKAPVFTQKEIMSLSKMGIQLKEMGNDFQMTLGHIVAKYFPPIVNAMETISKKANEFIASLMKSSSVPLGEIFETVSYFIGEAVAGWKMLDELLGEMFGGDSFIKQALQGFIDMLGGVVDTLKFAKDIYQTLKGENEEGLEKKYGSGGVFQAIKDVGKGMLMDTPFEKYVTPQVGGPAPGAGGQKVEINQNINFSHDGKDAMATKNDFQRVMESTIRQMPQGAY